MGRGMMALVENEHMQLLHYIGVPAPVLAKRFFGAIRAVQAAACWRTGDISPSRELSSGLAGVHRHVLSVHATQPSCNGS
jgi:hypothetical protein